MRNQFLVSVLAAALCAGCAAEPEPPASAPEPDVSPPVAVAPPATIVAERGGFIPEGVEYDAANGRFLTGSLSEGSILQIHNDGRVTTVVSDADLVSSIGIEVDAPRDRLLVANSDRSVFDGSTSGQAKLGVYNLTTGERLAMVDLAAVVVDPPADAAYFANDVTVGDDGTAYVTDTRMNVLYRVDADHQATVLYRFEPMEGLGLNGIVHHGSGYLLVAGGATLWKVTLDDSPQATQVTLPEEIPSQDGMVWTADGRLAIVSGSGNRVVALTSGDDWATAQLAGVASYETQATTAAVVGDDIYVVHPHFADADPPSLERVVFSESPR
jgi:sugar lactone lactonase YvrE